MDNRVRGVVIGSFACAFLAFVAGGCTVTSTPDRSSKEIEALQARVRALEAKLGNDGKPEQPPLSEAQFRQAMGGVATGLEKKLDGDIAKEGQNQGQSARVTSKLGPLLGQAHVDNLRCSGTLCRLETTHPSEAAYGQFLRKALLGFGATWQGAFTITTAQALPAPAGTKLAPYKSVVFLGPDPGERFPPPVVDDCGGCLPPQRAKGPQ